MHRHHLRYKNPEIIIRIPGWYHWLIHCPAALIFWPQTQHKWSHPSRNPFDGAIAAQNKAAKSLGVKWLLGYPNLLQILLNTIGWVVWGGGYLFVLGIAIALFILL